jgi:hypothetical protein
MREYENQATEDADSDKIKEKFTGIVFVIFESPIDCLTIRRQQHGLPLKLILSTFFGCCMSK